MSDLRRTVELRAGPLMVLISRLPVAAVFGGVLVLLVGGLVLGGPLGLAMVAVVLAFVGLQLFFAWPLLPPPQRLLRLAVIALVLVLALTRA